MKRSRLRRKSELRRTSTKRSRSVRKKVKSTTYTHALRVWIHERDNGLCQVCGCRGTEVHHVIPRGRFKAHPERYTFIDVHNEINLMLVCWKCHIAIHHDNEALNRVIEIQEQRFGALRAA